MRGACVLVEHRGGDYLAGYGGECVLRQFVGRERSRPHPMRGLLRGVHSTWGTACCLHVGVVFLWCSRPAETGALQLRRHIRLSCGVV